MKKIVIIILAVVAVAGFGIYKLANSLSRAGEAGDAVVSTFHGHYNANRVKEIIAEAAPDFRSTVSPDKFTGLIRMLREKLGERKSGERSGLKMNTDNGNTTLEITYDSTFEKASGTEEFVLDYNGEVPQLLGYHVKSAALLTIPPEKGGKAEDEPAAPANP